MKFYKEEARRILAGPKKMSNDSDHNAGNHACAIQFKEVDRRRVPEKAGLARSSAGCSVEKLRMEVDNLECCVKNGKDFVRGRGELTFSLATFGTRERRAIFRWYRVAHDTE